VPQMSVEIAKRGAIMEDRRGPPARWQGHEEKVARRHVGGVPSKRHPCSLRLVREEQEEPRNHIRFFRPRLALPEQQATLRRKKRMPKPPSTQCGVALTMGFLLVSSSIEEHSRAVATQYREDGPPHGRVAATCDIVSAPTGCYDLSLVHYLHTPLGFYSKKPSRKRPSSAR